MSARAGQGARPAPLDDSPGWFERLRPEEGWWSVALVMLLTASLGWSVADARWILGRDELTSFLIWIAPLAALWGFVSARLGLRQWLAHLLGAVIGAFVIIEAVGAVLPDATPGLQGWFQATAHSVFQAYLDLAWYHKLSTPQYGHFMVALGILVWGSAQAASYDVFGHRRPLNGVVLLAALLIANMALTFNDQFVNLVLFTGTALLLLLLTHAADEQATWLRHRIWRAGEAGPPNVRGGVVFTSIAVVGALVLTTVASSAPLAHAWPEPNGTLTDFASWVSRYLPAGGGGSRFTVGADFGSSAVIQSSFSAPNTPVFTVRVSNVTDAFHWRLVTYDVFQSTGWTSSPGPASVQVAPNATLEAGTQDLVTAATPGRRKVTLTVTVQDHSLNHVVVADEPASVNVPATVSYAGKPASATHVASATTSADSYQVTAYVPDFSPAGTGLTEWKLRGAGTSYPPGLLAQYTQGADRVGAYGRALLNEILTSAPGHPFTNNFDRANAIQDYLRNGANFTYSTNISAVVSQQCTDLSTVDCFAKTRVGFCEQYATTMVMLLRMLDIPARYVQGYLPGSLDANSHIYQVTRLQSHAWVEAYFPHYGWIEFDPTGGNVGTPTVLPAGAPGPSPTPGPSIAPGQEGAAVRPNVDRGAGPSTGGGTATSSGSGFPPAGLLLGAVLVAVIAIALFLRRRPRRLEGPDAIYRSVTRLAGWLGYRPQPTQTIYEYVGMLGAQMPQAREPLDLVAMAKVEVTYGRRELGVERLEALARARARLRRALLWLAVRRPRLPRRPRRNAPG